MKKKDLHALYGSITLLLYGVSILFVYNIFPKHRYYVVGIATIFFVTLIFFLLLSKKLKFDCTECWLDMLKISTWPIVILVALTYFGKPIANKIEESPPLKHIGSDGIDFSERQNEVEIRIELAETRKVIDSLLKRTEKDAISFQKAQAELTERINQKAESTAKKVTARSLEDSYLDIQMLWIDDKHYRNNELRELFTKIGIKVDQTDNTKQAVRFVSLTKYDIIISDFYRSEDPEGGYTLLRELQKSDDNLPPYVIYARSSNPEEDYRDAVSKGAYGSTNDPNVLIAWVNEISDSIQSYRKKVQGADEDLK
ncbi:MAG: response regulator [Cyclobacteriaceae bacterium]